MSNRYKDKLEDLFSRIFNKDKKGKKGSGWDTPPLDLWDQIEQELVKDKQPERPFLYWWMGIAAAMLLLLLLNLSQLYQSNQQLKTLSSRLENSEHSLKDIQQEVKELKSKHADKRPTTKTSNVRDNRKPSDLESVKGAKKSPKVKSNSQAPIGNSTDVILNKIEDNKNQFAYSNTSTTLKLEGSTDIPFGTTAANNKTVNTETPNKVISSLISNQEEVVSHQEQPVTEKVSSLSFSTLDLPVHSISADLANLSSLPIQPVINKKPSFYVAAMFSPIWTSSKTIGTPKRPADLPKKEVQESAFTSGVDIGLNLPNNWSIESGFHITSVNKRIQHTRNFNFAELEERRVDNDNFESEVDLTLGSSSGTIDAAISLSRIASTSIADETEVNLDIVHTQHKEFLDIPVIVKKQVRIRNWEWSIRGGVVNRFL